MCSQELYHPQTAQQTAAGNLPACLPEVASLQLISLLGYRQPFGSTPDLISLYRSLCFQEGAQGGFPYGGRGQNQPLSPMLMVQWQLALTEPNAFLRAGNNQILITAQPVMLLVALSKSYIL